MLIVHHLENSRSHRVIWALEELQLPYEIKLYKRHPKTMLAPESLKQIHPIGKAPILEDEGTVIIESAVILEYLRENYSEQKLQPKNDSDDWQHYHYWMHAAEGSIMPYLVMKLVFEKTTQSPVPFFVRPITKAVAGQVFKSYIDPALEVFSEYLNSRLAQSAWVAGEDFTLADIQLSYVVHALTEHYAKHRFEKISAYYRRLKERPAFKEAIRKGGPL
ncbi:MAG: glutathione S-transferase [Pseudobacteriovorax sp.]|nr:glutathione S-transferase [Pseudobacteriovorax sp.]